VKTGNASLHIAVPIERVINQRLGELVNVMLVDVDRDQLLQDVLRFIELKRQYTTKISLLFCGKMR